MEHPGNVTLLVSRPKGSDLVVKTAQLPSLDMTQESKYDVWVYPHGDDTACKRLVDCANKYLHGEKKESNAHFEKRMALQKFCSGREHTAMPKPTGICFDRNKLTAEQLSELEKIEAECSPDQRAVLDNIYSCQSAVHVVQGPPGSGKTWFAAKILVPILNIFGLKANCYASSNAATDAFADNISLKLKPIRYHDPPKERSIGIERVSSAEPTAEFRLKNADYVITTCSNAADKRLRRCTNPRVVIIDDAGRSRELETLMALYHNLESADMFIILGDANQSLVVPTLHHRVNDDDPSSPPYNEFAPQLATSFMARQIANGISHSTFTKI